MIARIMLGQNSTPCTRDCDLIVLGDSGRGRWASRRRGDTSLHVVRHSDHYLFVSH